MSNRTSGTAQQTVEGSNIGGNTGGSVSTAIATSTGAGVSTTTPNTITGIRKNRNRYRGTNQQYGSNMPKSFTPKITSIEPIGTASENENLDFYKVQKSIHHYVITNFTDSKHLSKAIMEYKDPHDSLNDEKKTLKEIRLE